MSYETNLFGLVLQAAPVYDYQFSLQCYQQPHQTLQQGYEKRAELTR
jgi:hypothetical protein